MASLFTPSGSAIPATTLTKIYDCPANKTGLVTIVVCNRGGATTYRLSIAPLGAADATSQYIVYDAALAANETKIWDELSIQSTDSIRAYAASANVTVNVLIKSLKDLLV